MSTYYVATAESGGDNGNPGTVLEPWLTFTYAETQISSGDTVYGRGGTYHEDFLIDVSGSAGNLTTFRGYEDERPIIDGEYTLPSHGGIAATDPNSPYYTARYAPLIDVYGHHISVRQFETKRSWGKGITIYPEENNEVIDCWMHDCRADGILAQSDNNLIEDCKIWLTNNFAPYDRGSGVVGWGAGIAVKANYVIVRGCVVYNNWGEGIIPWRSEHITVEDCVVYDNFALGIYLEQAQYCLVQRNLVYNTNDGTFLRSGDPCTSLEMADEQQDHPSTDNTIINNILIGGGKNLVWYTAGGSSGLINTIIAGNTLIEAVTNNGGDAVAMHIGPDAHSNTIIKDNIIIQETGTLANVANDDELDFDYNCWYNNNGNTPEADAQGANDINDNPDLVDHDHALVAGAVDVVWYKLTAPSPCRDVGVAIAEVTEDYWEITRADPPDIGAHEYAAAPPPPPPDVTIRRSIATSSYKIRLKSAAGVTVAEVTDFEALCYAKRVNRPGLCTFTLDGDHAAIALLEHKSQVEIWRRNLHQGIDWHCDYYGLYLSPDRFQSERNIFTTICPGQMWFLSTRVIAWYAATVDRTKFTSDPAETIMKTLVDYNACANATTGNGRLRNGAITGLSIQADGTNGNSLDWNCAHKNLLTELQDLAQVAGGDFDLIKTAAQAWEFRWYTGQRGTDRRSTVIFARERGNMANIHYLHDRMGEKTAAIVGGQGEEDERDIVIRTGDDYSASNDVEIFVDARRYSTTAGYNAAGDKRLSELRAREMFSFEVVQTPSCFYGQVASGGDYELGDLTTARAFGIEEEPKIVGVTVTVVPAAEYCEVIDIEVETPMTAP